MVYHPSSINISKALQNPLMLTFSLFDHCGQCFLNHPTFRPIQFNSQAFNRSSKLGGYLSTNSLFCGLSHGNHLLIKINNTY
ncbi:hypothetical protein Dd1591_3687 [Dickeya chrysanthemi Ech1591]|uniref:Uncharacterized protein n=1 Tax=Dickeya chrysanthemi (strain Ech1591) TaxID=561229 RepID=C6CLJ2_DICC1|nr:hypothetical protein Dd1591_3687 [Dickeya chrysanthemi Ech1591]